MPTKKRKYNARFPAGRIKKIMQTDEEVGKVAQAVPIIIFTGTPRTLELFVESLLSKAMQVTVARNAKTLSPSHVKQCILAESKFDFLRDLVKNIPDVSAAEEKEKELMSAESSPNSSRFQDMTVPPRRIAREDSNSSNSCDVKTPVKQVLKEHLRRTLSAEEPRTENKTVRPDIVKTETVTSSPDVAIDLSKKSTEDRPIVTANFYQETLLTDDIPHPSVITVNPSYTSPQPSTSYTPEPLKLEPVPKQVFIEKPLVSRKPFTICLSSKTPVIPIVNIDFTKNITKPEIKLLDTAAVNMVGVTMHEKNSSRQIHRQNSKPPKTEIKKMEVKPIRAHTMDIDSLNSGNLQIDEDYDT